MEIYTLDSFLRRTAVVDTFESLIWAERFRELGDFKFTVVATNEMRSLFVQKTMLAINESYRVMVVENVIDTYDSSGRQLLQVSGRSLELILMNRVAMGSLDDLATTPTWDITDYPADIARKVFDDICRTGILKAGDVIPYLQTGSLLPTGTIGEPSTVVTLQFPPATVYDTIKSICDVYDLGFRLLRDPVTNQLYFDIYTGRDLTSGQTSNPAVIFSRELDNLTDTKQLTSVEDTKNCAYVYSPIGTLVVYNDGESDSTTGFDREVLMVDASDLTEATDVTAALTQRGVEALAAHRGIQAFDGEINQQSSYKYGTDYHVGDLVEQRNSDGFANYMRITEQILTSDGKGERSYPTMTKNLSITPGSWIAWDFNEVWEDMGLTDYWADQI